MPNTPKIKIITEVAGAVFKKIKAGSVQELGNTVVNPVLSSVSTTQVNPVLSSVPTTQVNPELPSVPKIQVNPECLRELTTVFINEVHLPPEKQVLIQYAQISQSLAQAKIKVENTYPNIQKKSLEMLDECKGRMSELVATSSYKLSDSMEDLDSVSNTESPVNTSSSISKVSLSSSSTSSSTGIGNLTNYAQTKSIDAAFSAPKLVLQQYQRKQDNEVRTAERKADADLRAEEREVDLKNQSELTKAIDNISNNTAPKDSHEAVVPEKSIIDKITS
jgi:hypothetical protein